MTIGELIDILEAYPKDMNVKKGYWHPSGGKFVNPIVSAKLETIRYTPDGEMVSSFEDSHTDKTIVIW